MSDTRRISTAVALYLFVLCMLVFRLYLGGLLAKDPKAFAASNFPGEWSTLMVDLVWGVVILGIAALGFVPTLTAAKNWGWLLVGAIVGFLTLRIYFSELAIADHTPLPQVWQNVSAVFIISGALCAGLTAAALLALVIYLPKKEDLTPT